MAEQNKPAKATPAKAVTPADTEAPKGTIPTSPVADGSVLGGTSEQPPAAATTEDTAKDVPAVDESQQAGGGVELSDGVVVGDRSELNAEESGAAELAQESKDTPIGEFARVDSGSDPGDRLVANATLTSNPHGLPSAGTGYHCGYCGGSVGTEGEHYDPNGNQVPVPHANVMVVADSPENAPVSEAKEDKTIS